MLLKSAFLGMTLRCPVEVVTAFSVVSVTSLLFFVLPKPPSRLVV